MSVSSKDFSEATQGMMTRTAGRDVEPEQLVAFIEAQPDFHGKVFEIEMDRTPRKAGASSGTQLFDITVELNGKRDLHRLVFRYDTGATFFSQYDMAAQYEVMSALFKLGYPVPETMWLDRDGRIYGTAGMIMARIEATPPHVLPFEEGPIMDLAPDERSKLVFNIVRTLARLHNLPLNSLHIPTLHTRGGGRNPLEGEILWGKKEIDIALDQAQLKPDRLSQYVSYRQRLDEVANLLLANAPVGRPLELVHADPGFVNYMFRGSEIAAVLDWEVAQLGYGESDIAYVLSQIDFYHMGRAVTEGVPSHDDIKHVYAQERGCLRNWEFCALFSAWRMANYTMLITSRFSDDQSELENAYFDSGRERLEEAFGTWRKSGR
ncbi:phosphotransferase family protein [Novosphingobium cyanobacteriorum]|uniref:Phosphotransferase family protein n=1 Tax=Novosphingobium cyanobacteriorum TaxID=3024215 RepID=A0ABT6CE61_9SPHN|nr:phosphotransferase family protein [Novosphingobium cyanobacteriorum]MDF8332215.1 phosphotransferase family protein [Novosphingobium cyanobacteriorum]